MCVFGGSPQVTAPPLEQTQIPHGVAVTSSKHQTTTASPVFLQVSRNRVEITLLLRCGCRRTSEAREKRRKVKAPRLTRDSVSEAVALVHEEFPPRSDFDPAISSSQFYCLRRQHHCSHSSNSTAKGPRPVQITQVLWWLST